MTVMISVCLSFSILPFSAHAFTSPVSARTPWGSSSRVGPRAPAGSREILLSAVNDDSPRSSEFEESGSTIDWDSEWKKVVLEDESSAVSREPGRAAWTDADRAKHKVTIVAMDAKIAAGKVTKSMPSVDSLTGDWRFWLGVIAVISFGSAFIGSVGQGRYPEEAFML